MARLTVHMDANSVPPVASDPKSSLMRRTYRNVSSYPSELPNQVRCAILFLICLFLPQRGDASITGFLSPSTLSGYPRDVHGGGGGGVIPGTSMYATGPGSSNPYYQVR